MYAEQRRHGLTLRLHHDVLRWAESAVDKTMHVRGLRRVHAGNNERRQPLTLQAQDWRCTELQ
jgi:hypothetical protein